MRQTSAINNDWYFTKAPQTEMDEGAPGEWERIELPHTWNAADGQGGSEGYYRGRCHYFKELYIVPEIGRRYFLKFDAAAYDCTVCVNGAEVAHHKGGYSAFVADITEVLRRGNNNIAVTLSNSATNDIYPQLADFTFYGGIHRGAWLISVPKTHFALEEYAEIGISASSKIIGIKKCYNDAYNGYELLGDVILTLQAHIVSPERSDTVRYTLTDPRGDTVITAYASAERPSVTLALSDVMLWHGVRAPRLYRLEAELIRNNDVLDAVSVRHGFRSFSIDPQRGFYLNGELTPLRGVARHEDRLGIGNALTAREHAEDIRLICELGANTVRLSHYQHASEFYELCDERGLIVWSEIPYISRLLEGSAAQQNARLQLRELIVQCREHPSVCFWGIANEITIGGGGDGISSKLCELNALAHELDGTRPTAIAQVTSEPKDSELNFITDLLSYNHYFGWYMGKLTDNDEWLDEFHNKYPKRAIGLSEYGCEGIVCYHSDDPRAGDYSEEYQCIYHEHMLELLEKRPWIWSSYVWNMFDFGSSLRNEGGVSGRNDKGLVSFDRRIKKDAFYLYKAYWSSEPFVHICGKRRYMRTSGKVDIKVYSNAERVALYCNGEAVGEISGKRCFLFNAVSLRAGTNTVTAVAGEVRDSAVLELASDDADRFTFKDGVGDGVVNWFDGKALDAPQKPIDGAYYSVRDTLGELAGNEQARKLIADAFASLTGMPIKGAMLAMLAERTPEQILSSSLFGTSTVLDKDLALSAINAELQLIKKQ